MIKKLVSLLLVLLLVFSLASTALAVDPFNAWQSTTETVVSVFGMRTGGGSAPGRAQNTVVCYN